MFEVESSTSKQVYEFDDGTSPEDALAYIDKVETPPSNAEVFRAAWPAAKRDAAKLPAALMEIGGRVFRSQSMLDSAKDARTGMALEAEETTPKFMNTPQQMLYSGLSSIPTGLEYTAATIATGGGATLAGAPLPLAAKTAARVGLGTIFTGEGIKETGELLGEGKSPVEATARGIVHGAAEAAGEMLPLSSFLKGTNIDGLAKFAWQTLGKDIVGEELTTVVQFLNKLAWDNEDITLAEAAARLKHEMVVTAGASVIGSTLQTGAATGARAGIDAFTMSKSQPVDDRKEPTATPATDLAPTPTTDAVITPKEVMKTPYSEVPVWDEATQSFKNAGDIIDISPSELPFEQRLERQRMRTEELSMLEQSAPGFAATAEQMVEFRARIKAARDRIAQDGQALAQEIATNPDLMQYTVEQDFATNAIPGDITKELQGRAIEIMRDSQGRADTIPTSEPEAVELQLTPGTQEALANVGFRERSNARPFSPGSMLDVTIDERGRPIDYGTMFVGLDGPYQGKSLRDIAATIKPGETVATVAGASTPDMQQRGMSKVHDAIASWVKAFDPSMSLVMLNTPENHPIMNGVYSSMFRINDSTYGILLPQGGTELYTAAHEFGHALTIHNFFKEPNVVTNEIVREYQTLLEKLSQVTFKEGISYFMSAKRAKDFREMARDQRMSLDQPFYEVYSKLVGNMERGGGNYFLSFDEYLAESLVKYTVSRGGVTPEAKGFFDRLLVKLAKFYNSLKGEFSAMPKFTQWMDSLLLRQPDARTRLQPEVFKELRANAAAAGMHPDLVKSLTAPGSDPGHIGYLTNLSQQLKEAAARKQAVAADVYEHSLKLIKAFADVQSEHLDTKLKTKTALLKQVQRVLGEKKKNSLLMQSIYELAQNPEFAGKYIDPQKFMATLMTRLGNWRVQQEIHRGSYTVTTMEIGPQGLGVDFVNEMKDVGNHTQSVTYDSMYNTNLPENIPRAVALLTTAARNGARVIKLNRSDFKSDKPHTLVSILSGLSAEVRGLNDHNFTFEIPYWAYEMIEPQAHHSLQQGGSTPSGLAKIAHAFGMSNWRTNANESARYNWFLGKALGAFQMAKLNEHVPGVPQLLQAFRNRMRYKAEWMRPADGTLKAWSDLPKAEAESLSRLLFDEAIAGDSAQTVTDKINAWGSTMMEDPARPGRKIFQMKPKIAAQYKLGQRAQEVYSEVRSNYMAALDEMQKVGIAEISRQYFGEIGALQMQEMMRQGATIADMNEVVNNLLAGTPQTPGLDTTQPSQAQKVREQLAALADGFKEMRDKPYTPYPRFGKYGVLVTDESGKTVYFETFESQREQKKAFPAIQQEHKTFNTSMTYIEDLPQSLTGMPPQMVEVLAQQLELTPAQVQQIRDYVISTSNANAFLRKMRRRKGVSGYTEDAMRGFADYFRKYGNHIARVKSNPEITDALKLLKDYGSSVAKTGGGDATKAQQLHEWYAQIAKYLNDPGSEMGALKSFVSLWHFGFNVSSAVMNLTQVPFVTLPYLSDRYGIARTLKELKSAYKDMSKWQNFSSLEPDLQWGLEQALDSYFLEESFATEIAQIADGSLLSRVQPLSKYRKRVNTVNHYAMWMFQKAESINRRATFIASFRLAKSEGQSNEDAFNFARSTVEATQGEYAQEARPRFMQGNWSVIFQFMQYSQNMIFQMLGGDQSWKRLMLAQLMIGGFLGLPFAEDFENAIRFLMRNLGDKDVDVERYARELLVEMDLNPDLIMRGLMSNVFGFDLSKRVSLGQILPGMAAIGSNQDFNDALSLGVGDLAGPGIGLMINAMKAMSDENPNEFKRMQAVMPSAFRNMARTVESVKQGGVLDRRGAMIEDMSAWDNFGYALGFQPQSLSDTYQAKTMAMEEGKYWTTRRNTLLSEYKYLMLVKNGDPDGMSAFIDHLTEFNSEAPDQNLRINMRTLRNSLRAASRANALREHGYGASPQTDEIEAATVELFQD